MNVLLAMVRRLLLLLTTALCITFIGAVLFGGIYAIAMDGNPRNGMIIPVVFRAVIFLGAGILLAVPLCFGIDSLHTFAHRKAEQKRRGFDVIAPGMRDK